MIVEGHLIEHVFSVAGIARRHLVPGTVLVHGDRGQLRETVNSGPGYAVSLHVTGPHEDAA